MAQNSQTQQLQTLLDTYTYSTRDSVPAKTLEVRKIHSYNDLRKLAKPHFCSSSSSSIELAYRKSGTSILLGFYMKRLLSVLCVILDQENPRNFTRKCKSKNFLICSTVGSHFLFVHVHSTFHIKVGLKRALRSRRCGARENTNIRESVDSLCRDGADTPIKPVTAQNSRTRQL